MKKKVAVIHTFLYSVEDIKKLFAEKLPGIELINIIDDSILPEAIRHSGVTPEITRRICLYALQAEAMGAECILSPCSSIGDAVDTAQQLLKIPYCKIDGPMAEEAVRLGGNIAVIATVFPAATASVRLLAATAKKLNKEVTVKPWLVNGAFAALQANERDEHNRLVVHEIHKAAAANDVIVLSQGSMYHLLPLLSDVKKPVLASLATGVEQIRQVLRS